MRNLMNSKLAVVALAGVIAAGAVGTANAQQYRTPTGGGPGSTTCRFGS